jgi:hypothetical protein
MVQLVWADALSFLLPNTQKSEGISESCLIEHGHLLCTQIEMAMKWLKNDSQEFQKRVLQHLGLKHRHPKKNQECISISLKTQLTWPLHIYFGPNTTSLDAKFRNSEGAP